MTKLELKEAARYSLEPTDADVQAAYDNVAQNMGVDAQKLTQILSNGGASAKGAPNGWRCRHAVQKLCVFGRVFDALKS